MMIRSLTQLWWLPSVVLTLAASGAANQARFGHAGLWSTLCATCIVAALAMANHQLDRSRSRRHTTQDEKDRSDVRRFAQENRSRN